MIIIRFIKTLFTKRKEVLTPNLQSAVIIPRAEHTISRANISGAALKVLNRLHESGLQAYLVGGGVRDLLLGLKPKDFDVATDAHPEKIRRLFRNSRLIGRRFRLVHVYYGPEIVEVATFRAQHNAETHKQETTGMIVQDNVYGNIQEDSWRRDFTINALYYNIADFSVVDFTSGMQDLKKGLIRMIGNPIERYHEDPVRMLRAVRLTAKLNFTIEEKTAQPIHELSGLLQNVSPARLFDEVLKLFYCGKAVRAFELLRHHGLFAVLFPSVEASLAGHQREQAHTFVQAGLYNTDIRIAQGQSLNPAFLFAVLFWWPLLYLLHKHQTNGMKLYPALNLAIQETINHLLKNIAIPKRFTGMMREIWLMQFQLPQRRGKRAFRSFTHPRFRAAYDFLILRAEVEKDLQPLCEWWQEFQTANNDERQIMIHEIDKQQSPRKRKRTK